MMMELIKQGRGSAGRQSNRTAALGRACDGYQHGAAPCARLFPGSYITNPAIPAPSPKRVLLPATSLKTALLQRADFLGAPAEVSA